jgi:hypothetical protein
MVSLTKNALISLEILKARRHFSRRFEIVNDELYMPKSIYFCKIDLGLDPDDNTARICDFEALLTAISALPFDYNVSPSRYLDIGEERKNYAMWVDEPFQGFPVARFALVRKDQHPDIDINGNVQNLSSSIQGNPLDYIHLVFFGNNVIGYELNQFGPKISALSHYLSGTVSRFSLFPITHCLKTSEVDRLTNIQKPTCVRARLRRESISTSESTDAISVKLRDFINELDGYEVLVQVKIKKNSPQRSMNGLNAFATSLVRSANPKAVTELKINGYDQDNELLRLNFKEARLKYLANIKKQDQRSANVDHTDAYRKITEVYNANSQEILAAYH